MSASVLCHSKKTPRHFIPPLLPLVFGSSGTEAISNTGTKLLFFFHNLVFGRTNYTTSSLTNYINTSVVGNATQPRLSSGCIHSFYPLTRLKRWSCLLFTHRLTSQIPSFCSFHVFLPSKLNQVCFQGQQIIAARSRLFR